MPPDTRENVAKLLNFGLAQKTWGSYKTAERMWKKCQKDKKVQLNLPWGQKETVIFIDWLVRDRGVAGTTVENYLSGIRNIHIMKGFDEPKLKTNLVKQILKGKKNLEGVEKRGQTLGRVPVTMTMLKVLKEKIRRWRQPMEKKLLMWAVCSIAFHGSFRIHEILTKNITFYDPDFTLMTNNVRIVELGHDKADRMLEMTIKAPKENKVGKHVIVDIFESGGPVCPVKAFCRWWNFSDKPEGPLFKEACGTPLTGKKFNAYLKELLKDVVDYKKGKVTSHSFRSGLSTWMGTKGFSDEEIKLIGRWSSRAFECYMKGPRTQRALLARRLGQL